MRAPIAHAVANIATTHEQLRACGRIALASRASMATSHAWSIIRCSLLAALDAQQLRKPTATLIDKISRQDNEPRFLQARITKRTPEMAVLRCPPSIRRQLLGFRIRCLGAALDFTVTDTSLWTRLRGGI